MDISKSNKISDILNDLASDVDDKGDEEVSLLSEVLPQYVQDHNDAAAYRDIDRQVNALSRAYQRIVTKITKCADDVKKIEKSIDIYGE